MDLRDTLLRVSRHAFSFFGGFTLVLAFLMQTERFRAPPQESQELHPR